MKRLLLASLVLVCACKPKPEKTGGDAAPLATPLLYAERGVILEHVESGRFEEAAATLAGAPDTADVRYLRAKLALAKNEANTAFNELEKAVEMAPGWPEYHYELGTVGPLPIAGLSLDQTKARHERAGKALARAVELKPDEPRYLYARAFYLQLEPPETGGDPAEAKKLFERIVAKHPDSAAAHRVLFDEAAREEDWPACEGEAAKVGEKDAKEGARLWLQLAGTYLATTTAANEKELLEKTKNALENAAKLHPPAANGFCDAGFALDQGGNVALADPFWKRCLELDPEGPKAAEARARFAKREDKIKID